MSLEHLINRRQSDAEVQELRRRMEFSPELKALDERLGEVEQSHADTLNYLGYNDLIPIDDGVPPAPPQNLVVTPVPYNELDATWDTPPGDDYVLKSVMEITPSGGTAGEVEGTTLFAFSTGLEGGLSHSVRVKLIDRWNRESDWSDTVSATPLRSVVEEIALDTLAAAGRITGQLPNANLAQVNDPAKLGEAAVKAVANAANLNMLPYAESKPDSYDTGAWATVGPGRHSYSTGMSVSVVADGAGKKWWEATTTAIDALVAPFGSSDYTQRDGEYYYLSIKANNPGGSAAGGRVRLNAYDSTGVLLGGATSSYTSVGAGATTTLSVKLQIPAGTSTLWWFFGLQSASTTLRFSDVMLEHTTAGAVSPSTYTVPALFSGAIGANLLATIDLIAANAIFANASISNGKIKDLAVDKLTAGTFSAGAMTLALSGQFVCGPGTNISANGLALAPTGLLDDSISAATYRVSNSGSPLFTSQHFYSEGSPGFHRGMVLRAHGDGSNVRGNVDLHGIYQLAGTPYDVNGAFISVRSKKGSEGAEVVLKPKLRIVANESGVEGGLIVEGGLTPNMLDTTVTLATNASTTITHNFGAYPGQISVFYNFAGNRVAAEYVANFVAQVDQVTTTSFRLTNLNTTNTFTFIVRAYK